jgi:hypothetical protein
MLELDMADCRSNKRGWPPFDAHPLRRREVIHRVGLKVLGRPKRRSKRTAQEMITVETGWSFLLNHLY